MKVLLVTLATIILSIGLVSSQSLRCYDCDPKSTTEDCSNPVSNSVRDLACEVNQAQNGTNVCVSAFVMSSNTTLTGIYRGCKFWPVEVADFCDWYTEETKTTNFTIMSCRTCNTTRCNTALFNSDGSVNGASRNIFGIFALVVNVLFFVFIHSY